jgi:predicted GH43/DUF377 family glycosyl hydrolase
MNRNLALSALTLLLLAAAQAQVRGARNSGIVLGRAVQLFVDDTLIDRMERVTRGLHYPERAPENPVLKPDQPWEGTVILQPGTVLFDEGEQIFKMWYNTLPVKDKPDIEEFICYAVSRDGIHWTKPALGIVEFRGSTANNILLKWCYWNLVVLKDDREPDAAKRYKMAYWNWHDRARGASGIWVAVSPDGVHWKVDPNSPVVPSTASGDTFGIMQDPRSRQFWLYHKSPMEPLRKVSRLVSDDFVRWRNDELILEPDDRDQPDTEFYGLSPFAYGDQYLGYLWVLHTYSQQIDVQLVSSRDGRAWERCAHRRVFFPLGFVRIDYDNDAFDSEMIMSVTPPVIKDGRLWMYYTGYSNKHNAREGILNPGGLGSSYVGQVGLARLRQDAFCSLDATSEGYVLTRPLRFEGSTMHVVASTFTLNRPGVPFNPVWSGLLENVPDGIGRLRVEVQDEKGNVIPGFAASDCLPENEGPDALRVSWKTGKNLTDLRGRLVRFRFVLSNARLHSFRLD